MALLLAVFTFQNPYPVQVRFMGWHTSQIPVIIIVLISFLIGIIISTILGLRQSGKLRKEIRRLKIEVDELKIPPIGSDDE
jgi:uncharacterized integral membrane protein